MISFPPRKTTRKSRSDFSLRYRSKLATLSPPLPMIRNPLFMKELILIRWESPINPLHIFGPVRSFSNCNRGNLVFSTATWSSTNYANPILQIFGPLRSPTRLFGRCLDPCSWGDTYCWKGTSEFFIKYNCPCTDGINETPEKTHRNVVKAARTHAIHPQIHGVHQKKKAEVGELTNQRLNGTGGVHPMGRNALTLE